MVTPAKTLEKSIAPKASLKADSLITVCFNILWIDTCLNTGIKLAGSVDATIDPKRILVDIGKFNM